MDTTFRLDQALHAVGQLLARRGRSAAIVVVGGTALNLLLRPTADELAAARTWITETQDPSPAMAQALEAVTAHVRAATR